MNFGRKPEEFIRFHGSSHTQTPVYIYDLLHIQHQPQLTSLNHGYKRTGLEMLQVFRVCEVESGIMIPYT